MQDCPLCYGILNRRDQFNMLSLALNEKYNQTDKIIFSKVFNRFLMNGGYIHLMESNIMSER